MNKKQQQTDQDKIQQLIDFPCLFPIKVVGVQTNHFETAINSVIKPRCKQFDANRTQKNESKNGKYLSLTCQVWVTSQKQLDDIYQALTSHPEVKYVL